MSWTHTCVCGSQVSKPVIDDVLNCLRIEVSDITITLSARWESHSHSAFDICLLCWIVMHRNIRCHDWSVPVSSSVGEREDWFHTLSRAIADHAAGLCTFGGPCSEARGWFLKKAFMTWLQVWILVWLASCPICVHRPVRSCGWPWERPRLYWCQFPTRWCAWTAPLTSASHWDDTTVTPAARSAAQPRPCYSGGMTLSHMVLCGL